MAENIQSQPEPDYGAKVAVENTAQAVAATQPAPAVPMPQGLQMADNEPDEQPQEQSITIKNPFMLMPATVNFPQWQQSQKTPVEADYDVGLLWQVLAGSTGADPTIKTIAKRLLGGD